MLALTAQIGDVAVRTDQSNAVYLLTGSDATSADNWKLVGGVGTITSVNGQTGPAVNLGASDVGLGNVLNAGQLVAANNLSDLTDPMAAWRNLGFGSACFHSAETFLSAANNLLDLADKAVARANLLSPNSTNSGPAVIIGAGTLGGATGGDVYQQAVAITPTINQSGSAGYSGLLVNITETSVGSGPNSVIDAQVQKLWDTKMANVEANRVVTPSKPTIEFDDFSKMDIRIGTIIAAEKVAKTKKLLKLTVDTGIDKRTVVSGIAEHYAPEEIIGQQVSILVNLAPRDLKGIESQGMILMAENEVGKLCFVAPTQKFDNGSEVR